MKAEESLAGAENEFALGRSNNCANRCDYACFQAAIAALIRAGVRPSSPDGRWRHDFVQAQFVGLLINRRKLFPSSLQGVLGDTEQARERADYRPVWVSQTQASRMLAQARAFVTAVVERGAER